MIITDVKIRLIQGQNCGEKSVFKASATITLDNSFAIHDIKIIEGNNGLFLAFPNKRLPSGDYLDIVHPINNETRSYFFSVIIDEYRKTLAENYI